MTPEQIETTARKLCEMRGIDPDGVEKRPRFLQDGTTKAVRQTALEWCQDEVRTFAQVGTAIASVVGVAQKKPRKRKE